MSQKGPTAKLQKWPDGYISRQAPQRIGHSKNVYCVLSSIVHIEMLYHGITKRYVVCLSASMYKITPK